jgi:type IV pilus assembly protein PilO
MKFDVRALKGLNQLDFEQVHRWPHEVKIVVASIVVLFVLGLGSYMFIMPKLPLLQDAAAQETQLRTEYLAKQRLARNLPAYQAQYATLSADFKAMLKALPTSNETPGLLDDITYVGTTSGLSFRLLNWLPEREKTFYTELPIQLEVTGSYHAFGQFVAKLANLPRIVTLHDFSLEQHDEQLRLQLQARTYRANGQAKRQSNESHAASADAE